MQFEKLKEAFPRLKEHEPLKHHSTFRVGGPADLFYLLTDIEELSVLIQKAGEYQLPWLIIGMGSNTIFDDNGFRGLVIKNQAHHIEIEKDANGERTVIRVSSGTPLASVIAFSFENGLMGLEALAGIPGTVGGSVYGNAGVPGTEIGTFVKKVSAFDAANGIREIGPDELQFTYRESALKQKPDGAKSVILEIWLHLRRGGEKNLEEARAAYRRADEARRAKQPYGMSAGSFFKNPSSEQPAGLLIDQAGCKGMSVGDAVVSEKHGNFFQNKGNATTDDIINLAKKVMALVKEKFTIELEPEVRILNETGSLIKL